METNMRFRDCREPSAVTAFLFLNDVPTEQSLAGDNVHSRADD